MSLPQDLDLLVALEIFLRERHVTRAAKRLGVTQSAASQKLRRLREHFGDPLLTPGRPLLTLTPRGEALAEPLSRALSLLRAAVATASPFDPATARRDFVILCNDLAEAAAFPLLLSRLAERAPHVTVTSQRAEQSFAERLEKGTADCAIVPDFLVTPSLRRLQLPDQRFVVVMRKGHPAAKGRLTLDRYLTLRHLVVAPRGDPGSLVDTWLEKRGKKRNVRARVQHFTTAPLVVAGTDLVVTCPEHTVRAAGHLALVAVAPPFDLGIDKSSLVWHERAHADPGLVFLRGLFAEVVRPGRRATPR